MAEADSPKHDAGSNHHTKEPLSGQWHSVGVLEIRRLAAEGATLILEHPDSPPGSGRANILLVLEQENDDQIKAKIHDLDTVLVCMGPGGKPANGLASRLSGCGYRFVFTPETIWGGLVAMDAAGAFDRS